MRTTEIRSHLAAECDVEAVADALKLIAEASVTLGGTHSVTKFAPITRAQVDRETREMVLVIQHP